MKTWTNIATGSKSVLLETEDTEMEVSTYLRHNVWFNLADGNVVHPRLHSGEVRGHEMRDLLEEYLALC